MRMKGSCHTRLLNPFRLHTLAGIAVRVAFLLVVVCHLFSTFGSSLAGAPRIL
jgi:hypothetical protein